MEEEMNDILPSVQIAFYFKIMQENKIGAKYHGICALKVKNLNHVH